jgi:hypothetical protein
MKKEWVVMLGLGNQCLLGDGFYISYLDGNLAKKGFEDFPEVIAMLDDSLHETAIVTIDDKYYILKGDYRKEYEAVIEQGLEACMKVFRDND